jgi:hypothetical protein
VTTTREGPMSNPRTSLPPATTSRRTSRENAADRQRHDSAGRLVPPRGDGGTQGFGRRTDHRMGAIHEHDGAPQADKAPGGRPVPPSVAVPGARGN